MLILLLGVYIWELYITIKDEIALRNNYFIEIVFRLTTTRQQSTVIQLFNRYLITV